MTGVTRIVVCRECGEEIDPLDLDVATLCPVCWDYLTEEADIPDYDDVWDPLARRDDEMGM
jgi:hypothetical protein